jgi:hypothetical protein
VYCHHCVFAGVALIEVFMRLFLGLFFLALSCTQDVKPTVLGPTPPTEKKPAANLAPATQSTLRPPSNEEILAIAQEYTKWGRVDELPGYAPLDCRAPTEASSQVRQSKAAQEHGQKLYYLFAKKKDDYLNLAVSKIDHAGQIVVKESWTSKEIKESEIPRRTYNMDAGPPPPIKYTVPKDGVALEVDQPAPLFIVMYVGTNVKDSDDGWWYATVSADKKTVTSSGVIASCQGCHVKAKYHRLFGLQE